MRESLKPLTELLETDEAGVLRRWTENQLGSAGFRPDRISQTELNEQTNRFLSLFRQALQAGSIDLQSPAWANVRQFLEDVSISRAQQGFSPSETATFVFSLKESLFEAMRTRLSKQPEALIPAVMETSQLLDKMGLYTTEVFQKGREQVIIRQQQELLELSTPVVTLWDGVLALPVIGTLDSARTQVVMENLLDRIVAAGASIAIIDITGVPTVDTLTAQHLLKTVAAARLMGADCIISGIRPQIAQTIVHLGVDLGTVVTKATLADALAVAMRRLGLTVTKAKGGDQRPQDRDKKDAAADRDED
jgi:rsbT co-antagonist protein RsbR